MEEPGVESLRVSVSIVTQGRHKFYTCTISSEVLAKCCFVTTRFDDNIEGFQRRLDEKRAQAIADYIDAGLGTIPSSIILSAQPEAALKDVGQGKTISFRVNPKAFLIIDGQHRVFGFSKSNTRLRVPVVIYTGLSRVEETRLFIDINSKQKGVPSELLLDIKKLADYERREETFLREVYDLFHSRNESALLGLTSPSSKEPGKISRATFNAAARGILETFEGSTAIELYEILNNYVAAFQDGLRELNAVNSLTNGIVIRSVFSLFPVVAEKVSDRFQRDYSIDNFDQVLRPIFENCKPDTFKRPGTSYRALTQRLEQSLKSGFRIGR
jgi:DGQHR domain-containing protein